MTFNALKLSNWAAVLAALAATQAPAVAASHRGDAPKIGVSTSGLDLTEPGDRRTLDTRIARAARRICDTVPIAQPFNRMRCIDKAIREARPQRDVAVSTAFHRVIGEPSDTAAYMPAASDRRVQR